MNLDLNDQYKEASAAPIDEQPTIATLWAMRMLTRVKDNNDFLCGSGFADDNYAQKLGLGDWVQSECTKTKLQAMRDRLHALEAWASQTDARVPVLLEANVTQLGELVGLNRTECRLIEFLATMHADSMLANAGMYARVGDDAGLYASLAHALRLDVGEVRQALRPRGKLLDSGIVDTSPRGGRASDHGIALQSHRLADALFHPIEDIVDLLGHAVNRCAAPTLDRRDFVHVEPLLEILVPHLAESLAGDRLGVNVLVHGKPGTGKTELARVMAREIGIAAFEIASEGEEGELLTGEKRLQAYRLAQSLLDARRTLLVFDEAEDVFRDFAFAGRGSAAQSHKAWMNRLLEGNRIPAIWITNSIDQLDPAFIRRFDGVLEVDIPPREQRQQLVQRYAGDMVSTADASRIAASTTVTPAMLSRACTVVKSAKRSTAPIAASDAVIRLIDSTLRAQDESSLSPKTGSLPPYYDPKYLTVDADIAALAQGIRRDGAARICLYGPPGTGKTALGAWLAQQLARPFMQRKASDLLGMFVGQTEKGIANAFREANRERAVLMIDEVDSFLADRRGLQQSWRASMVNEMLVQMEQFDGVFIASTNLMDALDQAAFRRFDLKLKLGYLLPEQAAELFLATCAHLRIDTSEAHVPTMFRGIDILTPGDFASIARRHRFQPFRNANAIATALRSECALKEDGRRNRIGFV